MKRKDFKYVLIMATSLIFLATSCKANNGGEPTDASPGMPNPASVYCEEQGGQVEIRSDEDSGQYGVCVFDDGSECDEWEFYRGECAPEGADVIGMPNPASVYCEEQGGQVEIRSDEDGGQYGVCVFDDGSGECSPESLNEPAPGSAALPTALPIDPADYEGWWTYTHPVFGFSLKLPEDWIVREDNTGGILSGHLLTLLPETEGEGMNIRLTFREPGDETLLWPTGVGEGEFIDWESLNVGGTTVSRKLLVCPSGEITSIWYQGSGSTPAIQLGELEFGIIYHASSSHCLPGISLEGKNQLVGEMIIASLNMP
jgi:putative hemolysin